MANTFKFGNGIWATKKGSTLAYNDENGNYKPLPFNFERASGATRVNKDGLIEVVSNNKPRIDFKDSADGSLLLEPARTNLFTYSNDVSFWTKSDVITTSDYAISPDGTQNAFRAVFSSSTGLLYISALGTTGTNNTLSVWAKSNNGSSNKFRFFGNGNTTKSNNYVATNEWQRFEFTFNCTAVTAGLTGASDSATNDILFYGFQHEVGDYATSYIPTQGSAVTRVADVCNGAGNEQVINSTEGVLYFEGSSFIDSNFKSFSLSNGSVSDGDDNRVMIGFQDSILYANVRVGNVYQFNETLTIPIDNNNKIALKYKSNDFALWVNGNEVKTGNNGTTFSQGVLNKLQFADGRPTTSVFNGNTKQIQYYNTALTDAELQALTS